MYTVEVDLWNAFSPPMSEHAKGIVLTRTIELPFPPVKEIAVFSAAFDPTPVPLGLRLKEIVWDADRGVFLASAWASTAGPIAMIPYDLRSWVDLGWRFGSWRDRYERPRHRRRELPPIALPESADEEEMESWESLPPEQRPPEFNLLLKALVRVMAEEFDDTARAYAIDRTLMVYDDHDLQVARTTEAERFRAMKLKFARMDDRRQLAWRDRVLRKHPRIQQLVNGC